MIGQVGARNSHLVKLYAVSLLQLIFVLAVVVLFTEIKEVFIIMIIMLLLFTEIKEVSCFLVKKKMENLKKK